MEPPRDEKYLTTRAVIIVLLTAASTFVSSVIFYLIVVGVIPGNHISAFMAIRPDIWLYFINMGFAAFFSTRNFILDKKKLVNRRSKLETAKNIIFVGTKVMVLFSLIFPICSDLIGHLILSYQPPYLYMYSTFVAVLALLSFPVALIDRIESMLPLIPILILFYFSMPILQALDDIVLYQFILVVWVGLFLAIEVLIYMFSAIIREYRGRKIRRRR
ncbi:MAG: hypothetical protein ACXQS8_03520 [Candidatus Helarchaeales archaeon]